MGGEIWDDVYSQVQLFKLVVVTLTNYSSAK